MDAIALLCHDHRMVEQLFRDYRAAANTTQRRGVVDVIVRELSKHAALEELMVYPMAKKALPNAEPDIETRLAVHMDVKRTLTELDGLEAGDERADGLMGQLEREIAKHVRQDEEDLFPKLREVLDQQALTELGEALDKGKRVAPTRPHVKAPDQPPLLAAAAPVAAIYDRLRDRLHGRPRT